MNIETPPQENKARRKKVLPKQSRFDPIRVKRREATCPYNLGSIVQVADSRRLYWNAIVEEIKGSW